MVGASGYAALETLRYAARHPGLELGVLESASHEGQDIAMHAPLLRDSERRFEGRGAVLDAARAGDVVVLAGTHGAARELAPPLLERGTHVVDLSDDFRLHERAACGEVRAVYGLTQRYRAALRGARLIANPGCYPTASLLALAPLAATGGEILQIVIDAKSGVTGAGRTPQSATLFAEVEGDVRAYGLGGHRHEPEIRQELDALGIAAPMIFTPHVVPLGRGMLSDCYAVFSAAPDSAEVRAAFERAYADDPFVRLLPEGRSPSLPAVARTNDAEIAVGVVGRVVRAICAIDNLGKGAAGQAIQNVNVMLGFEESTGLR